MTSPNLGSDGFPIVPGGLIWDGTTQYSDDQPEGITTFVCRLVGDGSRRYTETGGANQPGRAFANVVGRGWDPDHIGMGYTTRGVSLPLPLQTEGYLGYDGYVSADPVNQVPDIQRFRGHAARSAHELDSAMGHHTLQSATEDDRLAVFNAFSAMIGSAAMRYEVYEAIDPEELIVGGNFDGTLLWRRHRPEYVEIDDGLCGSCNIVTFARQFLMRGNLPLFRRLHRSGIIYTVDRDLTPWGAVIYDVATQPESQFYDDLDTQYHLMLRFYDEVVGGDPLHL